MSNRRVISLAAIAALGIACISADTLAARVAIRGGAVAYRGGAVGYRSGALAYRGVGYRGWGYRGDYYRPGLGLAAGAIVGGTIAASRPWYGYGGYGYGSGYYGYNPGYSTSYYPSANGYGYGGYGYDYGSSYYGYNPDYGDDQGYALGGAYVPSCSYVGGPKAAIWTCR